MVDATPSIPGSSKISPAMPAIKIANPDIILSPIEQTPIELMTDLLFEDIGGQEIISIARNDLVNGQNIIYHPLKNLKDINFKYNSKNILSLDNSSESYFNSFPIDFSKHIPSVGTGPNGEYVYIDSTGNLVINVVNLDTGNQVEIQVLSKGTYQNDTIY